MQDAEYGCIIPFDDESESFTNGFEAGRIQLRMYKGEDTIKDIVHSSNYNLFVKMCIYYGYNIGRDVLSAEWDEITLKKIKNIKNNNLIIIKGGLKNE